MRIIFIDIFQCCIYPVRDIVVNELYVSISVTVCHFQAKDNVVLFKWYNETKKLVSLVSNSTDSRELTRVNKLV